MLESFSNKAVMTKARAMYGRRITPTQYSDLANRHSVAEVATYLKSETHFSSALSGINESNIHRGQLEVMLRRDVFNNYTKLYHYLNTKGENLFRYVIIEEEINEILRMILLLNAHSADSFILDLPGYLIAKADIDLMALAKVRTYSGLVTLLANTPYGDILKRFTPREDGRINYIACEHAFFDYFFKKMFAMINKNYKGSARKELIELLSMRIELLNIASIVRSKVHFHAPPTSIQKRIFPYYYTLSAKKLDALIQAEGVEQLKKLLTVTPLNKRLTGTAFGYIENYTDRLRYLISRKYMRYSTNVSVSFYAFVTLSQIELNNTISIIEGIRYQVPQGEIKKLIIM